MPSGRLKGVATVVSLAAVVALFVILFHGFASGRSTGQKPGGLGSAAPPTSALPSGTWTAIPGLTNEVALPVIAPSNPSVVYEASASQNASAPLALRRSEDDGATWQKLPLPSGSLPPVDLFSLAVSPLDASTVFLSLSTYENNHPGFQCHSGQAFNGSSNALARLSGSPGCPAQYYSADAGQHWSKLSLPIQGSIGAPIQPEFLATSSTSSFRVQGQRLYSALGGFDNNGVEIGVDSIRIVASDDGGKTWQLVDAQLAASGQFICDYMPTSTGTTIFAITQTGGNFCYSDSSITDYLWRSDDGGATWNEVSRLPDVASNLALVPQSGSAPPLIYIHMPEVAQGGSLQPSNVPPELEVSADGGQTWRAAPTKGLPAGTARSYGPLGVLSNGLVLKAFQASDQTLTLCAWKNGESSWQQVTQHVTPSIAYVLVTTGSGLTTIWLVSQTPGSASYSVQRYDIK